MKFHLNSFIVVNLQSGHEKALQMIKGNNSKIIKSRDMVLVHDTSSYCALQLCEVTSK